MTNIQMDERMAHDARYRMGWNMAQLDWEDGAVNVQALTQDWTSFGVGYRDARRALRESERSK